MKRIFIAFCLVSTLQACVTPRIQTIWKPEQALPYSNSKILVVAIIPGVPDSIQDTLEKQTVQQLKLHGLDAVSYSDGFSIYQIAQNTTQEAAYFTLCEKGIDAVLTIAKVESGLQMPAKKGAVARYPGSFYFNHIWEYRQIQTPAAGSSSTNHIWEFILFDLQALQQQAVLQAKSSPTLNDRNETGWVANKLVRKLLGDRIIASSKANLASPKKAF